jgi:hypothetical protein
MLRPADNEERALFTRRLREHLLELNVAPASVTP